MPQVSFLIVFHQCSDNRCLFNNGSEKRRRVHNTEHTHSQYNQFHFQKDVRNVYAASKAFLLTFVHIVFRHSERHKNSKKKREKQIEKEKEEEEENFT